MGTDIAWCGEWTSDRRSPCVFQKKKKEKTEQKKEDLPAAHFCSLKLS